MAAEIYLQRANHGRKAQSDTIHTDLVKPSVVEEDNRLTNKVLKTPVCMQCLVLCCNRHSPNQSAIGVLIILRRVHP